MQNYNIPTSLLATITIPSLIQQTFKCLNSAIKTLEKGVKYVQS